ncbi:hypothetical protein [Rubritalea tangerina]|uniref:hypothetical protein n=1 Tax=Rubritalea tangerina TaxID=430798 RepID=UPI00362337B6
MFTRVVKATQLAIQNPINWLCRTRRCTQPLTAVELRSLFNIQPFIAPSIRPSKGRGWCALRSIRYILGWRAQPDYSVQTRQLIYPIRSSVFKKLLSFPRDCRFASLEVHHREHSEHYS